MNDTPTTNNATGGVCHYCATALDQVCGFAELLHLDPATGEQTELNTIICSACLHLLVSA